MEVIIQIPQEAIIEGIRQAFSPYMPKIGEAIAAALPEIEQEWITAPAAKKMLKEKGYKATSYQTLIALCKNHKVPIEKRGRDLWFKTKNIKQIPSKK